MANLRFDKEITALLVIDPYNDFISEGGKVWDRLKGIAEANKCVPHMLQVLNAARNAELRVFYALHRRYRPGDFDASLCQRLGSTAPATSGWRYEFPFYSCEMTRRQHDRCETGQ